MLYDTYIYGDKDCYQRVCRNCEEKEDNMKIAGEYLQSIIDQLYSNEKLNLNSLESDLDELCFYLNVKINPNDLKIKRI